MGLIRSGGFSQLALSTAASASTRSGNTISFQRPLANWSVSAVTAGSTGATLVLRGSAARSTDGPFGVILTTTATTAGVTAFSTAPFVAAQVRLDVDGVSSSGSISAWVAGA